MSVWQDLLSVSVTVEAYLLEDLLDTLAEVEFPINPEIEHHAELERDGESLPAARVEFPVWRTHLDRVAAILRARGFDHDLAVTPMLEGIRA